MIELLGAGAVRRAGPAPRPEYTTGGTWRQAPVIRRMVSKKARLRGVLIRQFTGTS
jgi:hypothetical protein